MSDAETRALLDRAWGCEVVSDPLVPASEMLFVPNLAPQPNETLAELNRRRVAGTVRVTGLTIAPR